MAKTDTKTRILDTAERLFAQKGFDAVSLRNIIASAKVNLAAVHYHYGSKQALIYAVIARRLRPINEERLAKLAEARANAGRRPVKLENVLECLFRPLFRVQADPKAGPEPKGLQADADAAEHDPEDRALSALGSHRWSALGHRAPLPRASPLV